MSPKYLPDSSGPGSVFSACTPEGVPIRQGRLPLRAEEMDELDYSHDFDCRTFDLGNPDDLKAYRELMDRLCNSNGHYVRVGPPAVPAWNPQTNSYCVFMQWVVRWAEVPRRLRNRMGV